jgi:hypothetical protein
MDFSSILVSLLILGTLGLLGWVELKSRRNQPLAESSQDEALKAEQLNKQR